MAEQVAENNAAVEIARRRAIVESQADPVSDAEDFRKIDNRARMENIR